MVIQYLTRLTEFLLCTTSWGFRDKAGVRIHRKLLVQDNRQGKSGHSVLMEECPKNMEYSDAELNDCEQLQNLITLIISASC